MADDNRPRRPKGTPSGGRFAHRHRPRPAFELARYLEVVPEEGFGDEEAPPPPHRVPVGPGGSEPPEPDRLATADAEELWTWIDHPDPTIQAEALDAPALTDDQLLALADPQRATSVRCEVAIDRRPLAGLYAADDPHPVVRALVASRDDCPEQLRDELLADPEVQAVGRRIAANPVLERLFAQTQPIEARRMWLYRGRD